MGRGRASGPGFLLGPARKFRPRGCKPRGRMTSTVQTEMIKVKVDRMDMHGQNKRSRK